MQKSFYGWVIITALFLMYMASNGIALNTFNLYSTSFAKDFNIPIEKAIQLSGIMYLFLALPLPFVGRLLERYSPKKLIVIGALGTIVSFAVFATARSYNAMLVFVILFPLFLSVTGLLTSMYIINNWFVKYRGIATGILLMGSSVGPALFAPVIGKWIKLYGWQTAALYEAIICSCLVLIPALLIADHPAQKNQYADGIEGTTGRQPVVDKAASARQFASVLRSGRFYMVAIVTAVLWFCIGGFIQNQRSYQADLHMDVQQSGLVQGLFFFCGLLGKLLFGWLSDKFDVRRIMLLSVANMALGAVLLRLSLDNSAFVMPAAILFGLGYSGVFTMIQLYVITLYGGPAYGKILGLLSFIDTLALVAGVYVLSNMHKASQNYAAAFVLMAGLSLFSLLVTFVINRQVQKQST